jgi:hypothetical protein
MVKVKEAAISRRAVKRYKGSVSVYSPDIIPAHTGITILRKGISLCSTVCSVETVKIRTFGYI